MRIAFFSPMPPSRSGIADYSAALVESLSQMADVTVFDQEPSSFDPAGFDIALYQIGNNGYHAFVYDQALRVPGVVVMHESNLHHLICETTIKRDDWDAYLREAEFDGGAEALAYARRVRALETGPDYEGVPMLRRVLSTARGVVAHSRFVEADVRRAGFAGPLAVIPHGAWIPEADRHGFRQRLGIQPDTALIGIFGFLKPYKRIAESLRAFKRLLRLEPGAKMILVGEPHPDFPLHRIIASLGIHASVRVLGFTPIEEFVGYIAACDIVLNLRYPTVGESSGTLLRSLGLGRAVIVSDIGSFSEYPDDICLKVPVDRTEEDTLFEYLSLLVSRREVREKLGAHARLWVERECNWQSVAERYLEFCQTVSAGREWHGFARAAAVAAAADTPPAAPPPPADIIEPEYIVGWAGDSDARAYVETHITRLAHTLKIVPRGAPDKRILEMGAYLQITPALREKLGYGEVRGCYYGTLGEVDRKEVTSESGQRFTCEVDLFDAERDPFPYPDGHFDTVLCCELIEHLPTDPMHMMSEVNRILKPGGAFVLTTPNICSTRAISAILQGYHPGFFPAYILPASEDQGARHAREYAPREIASLFRDSGLELTLLETGEFREEPHPEHEWVRHLLSRYGLETDLRGDGIYAVGVKRGPVRERYPSWLYS
jgi:glycosyltransferase involved in cell wall biosynthesis/SAM-dependent methyltransferase